MVVSLRWTSEAMRLAYTYRMRRGHLGRRVVQAGAPKWAMASTISRSAAPN